MRFLACGRFFEVWGMLFPISGKSVRFSYSEIKSTIQEYDNIYCYDLRSDYTRIIAGSTKRVPENCAKAGWDGRRESV